MSAQRLLHVNEVVGERSGVPMSILIAALWLILLAKLCWNVSVPFALVRRVNEQRGDEGISLAPMAEMSVLAVLVVLSALSSGEQWWNRWSWTAAIGLGSIVMSYLLMIVSGGLARLLCVTGRKRRADDVDGDA